MKEVKKQFMIIEKVADRYRIEPVLKNRGIRFERLAPTRYHIWVTRESAIRLMDTFDFVSIMNICDYN